MSDVDVDIRCADLELRRLGDGFAGVDLLAFAGVLVGNFLATQGAVHQITGSLARSGRAAVTDSSGSGWEGEIRYGGESTPKNVGYAVAELYGRSPKYGGDHDYLRPAHNIDGELVDKVADFVDRGHFTPHPEGLR